MYRLNKQFSILGFILVGVITLSGCATKKFVRYEIGKIDTKIAEVSNALAETNERVDAIDRRAGEALATAAAADHKATAAAQAAAAADAKAVAADRKADTAVQGVQQANNRVNTAETRRDSPDTYTSGEPEMIMFKVNSANLNEAAKHKLDSIASGIVGQKGYLIEIQGFTDTTGSESYNTGLSQRRAETALRYLVSKGVPLHRTAILGLGEERPVAGNESPRGREQNRRVEVRILQSAAVHGTN